MKKRILAITILITMMLTISEASLNCAAEEIEEAMPAISAFSQNVIENASTSDESSEIVKKTDEGIVLMAAAETVEVSTIEELQSAHPYSSSMDKTWVYTHASDADSLSLTFSEDTATESNYDYIYIYDGNDTQIGKYTGTALAGQTINVEGGIVKIRLTSDSSVNKNGFTVTNIDAVLSTGPITNLNLASRTKNSVTLSFPAPKEATHVIVEQSLNGIDWSHAKVDAELDASSTIATVTGLVMETQYCFRLNIVGGAREGLSNQIILTTYGNYTPEEYFEFSSGVITSYIGEDSDVIIPPEICGIAVTTIGNSAFYECTDLTSVTILENVTSIESSAFYNCDRLASLTIGNNVTNIGKFAFKNCTNLEKIYWNATNVNDLDASSLVFENVGTERDGVNIVFSDNVIKIPANLFYGTHQPYAIDYIYPNIKNVVIGANVKNIGNNAFSGCNKLKDISIPNNVTDIGNSAFSRCSELERLTIGQNVQNVGSAAFSGCVMLSSLTWNAIKTNDFAHNNNIFSNVGKNGDGLNVVFGEQVEYVPNYFFLL